QATPLTIVAVPVPLPASEAASLLVTDAAAAVPLPVVDRYTIVTGSFQTPRRATALAEELAQLGLPAFVRTTPSGLVQTVVGPFASREEAVAARARLAAAGQTDVLLVPSAPSGARLPAEVPRPSTGERALASAPRPDALQRATAL